MYLLKNARLIKELTEGYDNEYADVLIKDNKIEKILPCDSEAIENIKTIDLERNTLMPGLWDLHSHLYLQSQTCNTDVIMKNLGEELFDCYKYSLDYLKQGYTTIRDCGATMDTVLFVRDAINRGDLKGIRILACGTIITPTERGNLAFPLLYTEVNSPDELRKVARQELEKGADFLKYMGTGAFTNKDAKPGDRIATVDELKAIQEIAEIKNTYVAVHAHGSECIEKCIEIGIRTIEHASFVSDKAIDMLVKKESSYLIPTTSFWSTFLEEGNQGLVANADNKRDLVFQSFDRWNKAYKAGLKLGWGTDIPQTNLIKEPGLEFTTRKKYCGMKDVDLLLQATKNSAEIAGYGDILGTVKEGKIADLIVLQGKPDLDISEMKKLPIHVFRDGEKLI